MRPFKKPGCRVVQGLCKLPILPHARKVTNSPALPCTFSSHNSMTSRNVLSPPVDKLTGSATRTHPQGALP